MRTKNVITLFRQTILRILPTLFEKRRCESYTSKRLHRRLADTFQFLADDSFKCDSAYIPCLQFNKK